MLLAAAIARVAVVALAGVHGMVRAAGHGAPMTGAHIQLDGIECGATDSSGRYAITGLTAGQHEFRFAAPGFESRRIIVDLADGDDLALDLELAPVPIVLPPIDVAAAASHPAPDSLARPAVADEPGHYRFGPGWQDLQTAGGADIQQAVATAPGVSTRAGSTSALSIRGGRGSENLTLLDGIPLLGASHFAGASSAVNPDAISTIDVHTGVSSATYDGALSGVVELETADTATPGVHMTGTLSSSDVRSLVQASTGSTAFLVGGRTSFRDLLTDGTGFGAINGYQDLIGVARTPLDRGTLRVVTFESSNRMHWEPFAGATDATDDQSSAVPGVVSDAASWQTGAAGATWTKPAGTGAEWRTSAWWSGSSAAIMSVAPGQTEHLASGISEVGASAELHRRLPSGSLIIGATVTRPATWYRGDSLPAGSLDSAVAVNISAHPLLGAVYDEWSTRASKQLDIRAGLRVNTDFATWVELDPRMVVDLHPGAATHVVAGFGRTHQAVQSMLNEENLTSTIVSAALPVATNGSASIARADQWELSVDRRAGAATLALDSYVRVWHGVLTPAATTTGLFAATSPVYGDGRAEGVIASIAVARGPLALQAAAGLASATQQVTGSSYHSGFEAPWSFSGQLNYRAGLRTTFELQWATGAGQPATAVLPGLEWRPYQAATGGGEIEGVATNTSGAINALRLPGPVRIDVGFRRVWPVGASRRVGISTALRVENVLDRADPVGVVTEPDGAMQLLRGTPRGVVFELGWLY